MSKLILLAEDDDPVRAATAQMLEFLGYEVLEAENGERAIAQLEARPNDVALAVVDMTMPRMDGRQTLRELRVRRPELPVILASGYDRGTTLSGVEDMPRVYFLQKPYRVKDLEQILKTACEG